MSDVAIFLTGIGVTLLACSSVALYLKSHLKRILMDLCGTEERANFWTAFSNIMLIVVPIVFAMSYRPKVGPDSSIIFEISNQLKWALIGLVGSVAILGIVISRFIPPGAPAQRRNTSDLEKYG